MLNHPRCILKPLASPDFVYASYTCILCIRRQRYAQDQSRGEIAPSMQAEARCRRAGSTMTRRGQSEHRRLLGTSRHGKQCYRRAAPALPYQASWYATAFNSITQIQSRHQNRAKPFCCCRVTITTNYSRQARSDPEPMSTGELRSSPALDQPRGARGLRALPQSLPLLIR